VSDDYADHRFEIVRDSDSVSVEYQETQLGRGRVTVLEPSDAIYDALTSSEQFRRFAESALR